MLLSTGQLTQHVRDHIHDTGYFEEVVCLPQGCMLRTDEHYVAYRAEQAMELH
jgi:hypothetical protein